MSAKHNRSTPRKTDEDIWGLNAPIRFPVNSSTWRSFDPSVLREGSAHTTVPPRSYADTLGRQSIEETATAALLLSKTFPSDFAFAAKALGPEMWRWLYYRVDCSLGQMTALRFHPELLLRQVCEHRDEMVEPPPEWIGCAQSSTEFVEVLSVTLRQLDGGSAHAIWTVLALAQRVPLNRSEVLRCKWWTPAWVQGFAMTFNSGH